jgi:hypothetical protein
VRLAFLIAGSFPPHLSLRLLAPYRFGQVVGPSRASLDAVIIITRLPAKVNIYNDLQVLSIPLLALDLRLLNSLIVASRSSRWRCRPARLRSRRKPQPMVVRQGLRAVERPEASVQRARCSATSCRAMLR